MYCRKHDFEGYLDEAEVGENSSSSNVQLRTKMAFATKRKILRNCHLQQKVYSEVERQAQKS